MQSNHAGKLSKDAGELSKDAGELTNYAGELSRKSVIQSNYVGELSKDAGELNKDSIELLTRQKALFIHKKHSFEGDDLLVVLVKAPGFSSDDSLRRAFG